MSRILIGTCSWADESLIQSGRFYPDIAKTPEERLRYYASQFPLVEVDSTYYTMPSYRTSILWSERTPEGFVFDVKAFRVFTHHWAERGVFPRDVQAVLPPLPPNKQGYYYDDVPEEVQSLLWHRFREALLPLHQRGKLGLILFQFPSWVMPSSRAEAHILKAQEMLPDCRLAIEFRNALWLSEKSLGRTLSFLRSNRLSFVCVDEPQGFRSSLPPLAEVTADIAYVRFHGRNTATWEAKGITAAERFDWYYKAEEFEEWVPRIQYLREKASEVHLLMNTNRHDQGPANARLLRNVLQSHLVLD